MLIGPGPAGSAHLWEVYLLSLLLGVVNMFDNPARQTFVIEMVGKDDLPNAVSLNSIVMNGARVIGPAIGGVLIATVGLGVCFLVNAASYVAVIVALMLMRRAELHPAQRVARAKGQLREGVRYAWRTPNLRDPLMLVFVVGLLAYNFTVILPLLAQETFHGGAGTFALLTSLMAGGAVVGGLIVANRGKPNIHRLTAVGIAFSVMIAAVALSPTLAVALRGARVHGGAVHRLHRHGQLHHPAPGRADHARAGSWRCTPWASWAPPRSARRWWAGSRRPRALGWRFWSARGDPGGVDGDLAPAPQRAPPHRAGAVVDEADRSESAEAEPGDATAAGVGLSDARALQGSGVGGLRLLGEPEDPLSHDVALDLGGAAPDGLGAAEEERRLQVADGVVRSRRGGAAMSSPSSSPGPARI